MRIFRGTIAGTARLLSVFACGCLSGCAHYRPNPLPAAPDLTRTPALTAPAAQFRLPGLTPHPFPKSGLDETAVITLAVYNDPDLKAARLQAGVADAQLLQAGLLPDPQFSAGYASSAMNYGGTLGLSEEIQALITRGAAKAEARAHRQRVNLNILWQEWQIAERARELFIEARADNQLRGVLQQSHDLLAGRYRHDQAALRRGDVTSGIVSADLVSLMNAETSLRQLQMDENLTSHQLNALLGLQPGVQLHLVGPAGVAPLSQFQFATALSALSHRRVDLLALQAGYESEEQAVRRSILAQFPSLSAGVELERDPVEGVNAFGPQVSLTLPLFNRNRGQIAIQRATRALLRQTYQARLDQAESQADQLWNATRIIQSELNDLEARLPALRKTAVAAEASYKQDNLDAALYVSATADLLARQAAAIRLRASLENAQSALDMILGLPFQSP